MARAGVTLREIDLSQKRSVQVLPSGTPAGVVGTAKKGPAFVPRVFANMEQFGEIFGSITENSKDSNGHRHGPLALNEWMQNSQAGAFVRILGVGDGKKANPSTGKVTDAGFVVGDQLVQGSGVKAYNDNAVAAGVAGRTYFLGCYMSESAGSRYLSDAGLQSSVESVPVVRGVLMTPAGVNASLDFDEALAYQFDNVLSSSHTDIDLDGHSAKGLFGDTAGTHDVGYIFGQVSGSSGNDFKILLNGFKNASYSNTLQCSFDPSKTNYFANVLNTDPTKLEEEGHYLYSHWDISNTVAVATGSDVQKISTVALSGSLYGFLMSSSLGRNTADTSIANFEDFSHRYATAKTPYFVSQGYGLGSDTSRVGLSEKVYDLFRLHALDDGEQSHKGFRVLIENIIKGTSSSPYGRFDLVLESFESDPIRGDKLAAFRNLSLDPDSRNYIAKVIGDKHMYYDFDRAEGKQRLEQRGLYEVKNPYVRVELSTDLLSGKVPDTALPVGFRGPLSLQTAGAFADPLNLMEGLTHYNSASIPPLPYVRSIGRKVGTNAFSADPIPWGLKFGLKSSVDVGTSGYREVGDTTFNKSLYSFAKFFPTQDNAKSAFEASDTFNRNFFSLELIQVKTSSAGDVEEWGQAEYQRLQGSKSNSSLDRFVSVDQDAKGINSSYLRFRTFLQGGFDGLNIFDKEKYNLTNTAAVREANEEVANIFEGPTTQAFKKGIDIFTDKSAVEIQVLATPGITAFPVTDHGISACENRFDAIYIMDIDKYNTRNQVISGSAAGIVNTIHVGNTVDKFEARALDTSFAAAYFPDVLIRRPIDNAPVKVPASVGVLGVYSQNDSIADPWFAPAGLNRGRIQSAVGSSLYLRESELDEIYDADINPIYVPAGRTEETYIFGQKTLLQDPSALDRVNVRRLLINIRRQVKKVAETLLFEPNRESTLARFTSLVEPIMQRVQQRQGVQRYKVQIDASTTTDIDIENNTLRGRIFLQPTKSIEFVSLDFVVTNTISE
jgi:phage tail sheath protein FI